MQVLHEKEQIFPDGRRRERNIPLSEKLLPGEDPVAAARRGIAEELGSKAIADSAIEVQGEYTTSVERSLSPSYPGVWSVVRPSAVPWWHVTA